MAISSHSLLVAFCLLINDAYGVPSPTLQVIYGRSLNQSSSITSTKTVAASTTPPPTFSPGQFIGWHLEGGKFQPFTCAPSNTLAYAGASSLACCTDIQRCSVPTACDAVKCGSDTAQTSCITVTVGFVTDGRPTLTNSRFLLQCVHAFTTPTVYRVISAAPSLSTAVTTWTLTLTSSSISSSTNTDQPLLILPPGSPISLDPNAPLLIDTSSPPTPTHTLAPGECLGGPCPVISAEPIPRLNGSITITAILDDNPFTGLKNNLTLYSQCVSSYQQDELKFYSTVALSSMVEKSTTWTMQQFGFDQQKYTAKPPCCSACTVTGGDVQVYYWSTLVPNETQVVVTMDGMGFTYPSIYAVFNGLGATDLCGNVGKVYNRTTIGFAPGELSTSKHIELPGGTAAFGGADIGGGPYSWTALDPADFQSKCQNTTIAWFHMSCPSSSDILSAFTLTGPDPSKPTPTAPFTPTYPPLPSGCAIYQWVEEHSYNSCMPTLSVPKSVLAIDPAWKSCIPPLSAFFDPPSAVETVSRIDLGLTPAVPASPHSGADPGLPKQTDPASKVGNDPTAVQPTQDPSTPTGGDPQAPPDDPRPANPATISSALVITIGSSKFTADPSTHFTIGSSTLAPGLPAITFSGHTLSLDPKGTIAVIDGTSQTLQTIPAAPTLLVGTRGSATITAIRAGAGVIIAGQTIPAGGAVATISGYLYSLAPDGTHLVVDGTTLSLQSLPTNGIAGYIISALGYTGSSSSSNSNYTGSMFTGSSERLASSSFIFFVGSAVVGVWNWS